MKISHNFPMSEGFRRMKPSSVSVILQRKSVIAFWLTVLVASALRGQGAERLLFMTGHASPVPATERDSIALLMQLEDSLRAAALQQTPVERRADLEKYLSDPHRSGEIRMGGLPDVNRILAQRDSLWRMRAMLSFRGQQLRGPRNFEVELRLIDHWADATVPALAICDTSRAVRYIILLPMEAQLSDIAAGMTAMGVLIHEGLQSGTTALMRNARPQKVPASWARDGVDTFLQTLLRPQRTAAKASAAPPYATIMLGVFP